MGEAVSPAPAGIDSLRSQSVQLAAPVVEPRSGVLIPPQSCNMRKKSPHFHASSSSNMAVRGGLTRFARPAGSLFASLTVCPTGCASCRTPVGGSHPPAVVQHAKKKPAFSCELFFKYGGEGGIRTPDTLPYTHFPGVLLQPLGHLTILFCCLTAWGATGRYYRELRESGQADFLHSCLFG